MSCATCRILLVEIERLQQVNAELASRIAHLELYERLFLLRRPLELNNKDYLGKRARRPGFTSDVRLPSRGTDSCQRHATGAHLRVLRQS